MKVRSLELRTALMIQRMYGRVEERDTHAVLRTPSVPDFWYGNCLAMPHPPREGDFDAWMRLFAEEFPGASHRVFLMDSQDGDCGASRPFLESGFEVSCCDVLATRELRCPERLTDEFRLRPLAGDRDWEEMIATCLVVNEGREGFDRGFLERKAATIRSVVEHGRGAWWGAWDGDRLAAHMGLFWEAGLVRFQDVETHPDFRRRGACRSLLYRACEAVQAELGRPVFVIKPVDGTVRRIYESVGFTFREQSVDLLRRPSEGSSA